MASAVPAEAAKSIVSVAKSAFGRSKPVQRRVRKSSPFFEPGAPFPVGQTKHFLPAFTVQLNRTPNLSPRWAQFSVPLWFNKLDLRDYLWHGYNVQTHSIRTYVLPSAIRPRRRQLPGKQKLHRPRNKKRMTVELDRPFVWPEPPTKEELVEHWQKDVMSTMTKTRTTRMMGRELGLREKREELRAKAERLLKGEEKWGSTGPSESSTSNAGGSGPGHAVSLPFR